MEVVQSHDKTDQTISIHQDIMETECRKHNNSGEKDD